MKKTKSYSNLVIINKKAYNLIIKTEKHNKHGLDGVQEDFLINEESASTPMCRQPGRKGRQLLNRIQRDGEQETFQIYQKNEKFRRIYNMLKKVKPNEC